MTTGPPKSYPIGMDLDTSLHLLNLGSFTDGCPLCSNIRWSALRGPDSSYKKSWYTLVPRLVVTKPEENRSWCNLCGRRWSPGERVVHSRGPWRVHFYTTYGPGISWLNHWLKIASYTVDVASLDGDPMGTTRKIRVWWLGPLRISRGDYQ